MRLDGLVPPLLIAGLAVLLIVLRRRLAGASPRRAPWTDIAIAVALAYAAGFIEREMGRPMTYRHGPVAVWAGDIGSDQNSQQITDPYTLTHVVHGALFYGVTRILMPSASVGLRAIVAIGLEAAWEVYENTDSVINRYRTATIALGYYGDSVINSWADMAACALGFWLAWRLPARITFLWAALVEIGLALWIRDNLTLNIVMLLHPFDAIRRWQTGG